MVNVLCLLSDQLLETNLHAFLNGGLGCLSRHTGRSWSAMDLLGHALAMPAALPWAPV